jgi:hypothetical protein
MEKLETLKILVWNEKRELCACLQASCRIAAMERIKKGVPGAEWDQKLIDLEGHFLQSRAWAQFQTVIGREVYCGEGDDWCWMAVFRASKGIRYLLCSYGPVASSGKAFEKGFASLCAAAQEMGCDFVRFEPTKNITETRLKTLGARRINEVQPARTRIVDLTRGEAELRMDLSSGHRNLINGTEKRGISLRAGGVGDDIEEFLSMLQETARRSGVKFYPDWYYRKLIEVLLPLGSASFYMAEVGGKRVAGALFYDWQGRRYYAHAGAHQQLNREHKASVSLVWKAILDAKSKGYKQFDLWGVAPAGEPDHPWAGITQFKTSFGGRTIEYAGSWDWPLKKAKYGLYGLYRKMKGRE